MLVLSRKRDEKIVMNLNNGEKIELTVVKIDNNKVRIGIEAGEDVTILRSELVESGDLSRKVDAHRRSAVPMEWICPKQADLAAQTLPRVIKT